MSILFLSLLIVLFLYCALLYLNTYDCTFYLNCYSYRGLELKEVVRQFLCEKGECSTYMCITWPFATAFFSTTLTN